MQRVLALAAIAVLLGAPAATVVAQGTDFSGTWNLDRDSSELPQGRGGGGRGAGGRRGGGLMAETLVISQNATSITVEQQSGDQSRTIEYAIDGSETTVKVCTAPGFLDTRLRYAAWRSSYSSRASSGVRYASFSRRQHWL